MIPKRMIALLTIPSSNSVLIPTKRHTWMEHPVVKDLFKKRTMNDPVEAKPTL